MGPTDYTKTMDSDSRIAMQNVYEYLNASCPIEGYHYKFIENISESSVWRILSHRHPLKRNYRINYENCGKHTVEPDGGLILLVNDTNEDDIFLFETSENKFQTTTGNAIERFGKNYNFLFEFSDIDCEILPYVLFEAGKLATDDYLKSKLRQTTSYDVSLQDIRKNEGRLIYAKDSFTKEEMEEILMDVANQSYKYYKKVLTE